MYARGHFKQAYERVLATLTQLESTEGSVDLYATHYYKLQYKKAKLERKLRLLTKAESTCDLLISAVSPTDTPKLWWKYAIKASYLKVFQVAACMEFKIPKQIMENFALPTLKILLKHFVT